MPKGRNAVEGVICHIQSKTECQNKGIAYSEIPDGVRGHMVLILDFVNGSRNQVKVMTITSSVIGSGRFLPISPTRKQGYVMQLHLCSDAGRLVYLPLSSYVRIDEEYELPLSVLRGAIDPEGFPYMLWLKHNGGIRHLRSFLGQLKRSQEQADSLKSVSAIEIKNQTPDAVAVQLVEDEGGVQNIEESLETSEAKEAKQSTKEILPGEFTKLKNNELMEEILLERTTEPKNNEDHAPSEQVLHNTKAEDTALPVEIKIRRLKSPKYAILILAYALAACTCLAMIVSFVPFPFVLALGWLMMR